MGHDVQPIHRCHARALAVRQTQTATDGLLDQRARIGGPQRYNGIEVRHVPAFFEHIDVDDNFGGFIHAFHGQKFGDHRLFFCPCPAGIHLDNLVRITPFVKGCRLNQRFQL